jgi:superfamily I DNA/RNA helicase
MGESLFSCEFHQNMLDDENTIGFTGSPPIYEERRLFYVGMPRAPNLPHKILYI